MSAVPETIDHVVIEHAGKIGIITDNTRELIEGEFFIETLYSGISAGTELTFFQGTNPKGIEGWDQARRLFRPDIEPDLEDSFPKYEGYMEVGKVTASKNNLYPEGMLVAGIYHHSSGYIANDSDYLVKLPADFDPILGIWVAKMGPISMNGILYAADEINRREISEIPGSLKGQRAVVFGAGMIGLLCGIFAKWAGCQDVVIVDSIPERLQAAERLGLTAQLASPTMAIELKERWSAADSSNTGADIAFQCTGSDYLLSEAFRCVREQGTVIDLGFYQQGTNQVFLGKEFHHNRLRHICAQIGALPRGQSSWTKHRLSDVTIDFMREQGEQIKKVLVSEIVSFDEAQTIFERLASRDPALLQVVLRPSVTNLHD